MRRFITAATLCIAPVVLTGGLARAADPSSACDAGVVPPSSFTAGAGVRATSEPMAATVTACSTAEPLPGHVRVKADGKSPAATIVVDGDPTADELGCTDGYTALTASNNGAAIYHSPDGGFTSRARAKSVSEIAASVTQECTISSASA